MKNREKLLDEIFEAALQNDMIYKGLPIFFNLAAKGIFPR